MNRLRTTSAGLSSPATRSYTPRQMEDVIIKLLEQWQRRQQRQNER